MSEKHLHIISFDIPYPPNYGGVIDVFYKLRSLHQANIKIHLHCFEYHRKPAPELESLCEEVNYYPRNTGARNLFHLTPYIVRSRRSESLIHQLLKDDYPILFEGMHSCFYLADIRIRSRLKIYRESNIEHVYYFHLFKAEPNLWKRLFFLSESFKLIHFQQTLSHADYLLTVSQQDEAYLQSRFPSGKVVYLPSFHRDDEVSSLTGRGSYILYQAKLSVPENVKAAEYILTRIHDHTIPRLVIAGQNPPERLVHLCQQHPNTELVINPDEAQMDSLIRNAHLHLLLTFQSTGLKLKLLNALFRGRFCLVNAGMLVGTGLEPICLTASTPTGFREQIREIFLQDFTESIRKEREILLKKHYSNQKNCKILLDILNL